MRILRSLLSLPRVINDMPGGHVELVLTDPRRALGPLRSGASRPLAVASRKRVAMCPSVPTMIGWGVPDCEQIGASTGAGRGGVKACSR